jgi:hypothetical protein
MGLRQKSEPPFLATESVTSPNLVPEPGKPIIKGALRIIPSISGSSQ